MNNDEHDFFRDHPDPMWIFERETLRFLAVNRAAVEQYGYSEDEFLKLTIADIRPASDLSRLAVALRELDASDETRGIWTHRTKDGVERRVDIRSSSIRHLGHDAVWVVARDVSRLIALEEERNALLAREKVARQEAEAAARYYQSLFETLPGRFVVLDAEDYRIVSVSDAYLQTTMTQRDDILGRKLFDVSPRAPGEACSVAPCKLLASFDRVRETGRADIMAIERHPIHLPASQEGGFVERYWSAVNTPVRGPDGEIRFIIHRVEDVTDYVRSRSGAVQSLSDETELLELDILLRARELHSANERLRLKEKALQDALRIGGMGRWELDLDTETLVWSDQVHAIFGVSRDAFDGRLASFLDRVHPDDVDDLLRAKDRLVADGLTLEHLHRICRPNGEIRYVREIGERVAPGRLAGIIQDITEIELGRRRAVETAGLLRMAGHTARFGGWRIDLASARVAWSDEAAAIHDLPPGTSPSIDEALKYIAPEARQRVSAAFEACCLAGDSFDATVQLITAKRRRVWVRVVGEAERDACGNIVAVHGGVQDIDALVREREQAKKLAERLHETLDNISDAFLLLDHGWRFSYVNKEAARVLKHGEAELLGREIWSVFPEARDATFGQQYRKAVSERVTVFFTEYYPPLAKWFEVKAYPSSDGLAVYFRDVTSRRADQEQLRLLETAVSRLNDIVIITDTEPLHGAAMRIVYVNDAFVRLTGFSREEAIGNTPRILHGPGTQATELDRIRHALLNKEPVRAELLNYTRDRDELWLEIDMVPILDAGGRHTHWVAVERDITERKRALAALEISEERFRLATAATRDGIWDLDLEAGTVWWNDNLRAHFGFPAETTGPGLAFWQTRIHPDDKPHVLESLRAAIAGRDTYWEEEYRLKRADECFATVVDRGFLLRNADGRALRMVGSLIDVTERREMEERLRQVQKLEAVGQLTGGIAHDFNNLLTVILGNAEILAEQLPEGSRLRMLAQMNQTAAARGAELTARLLAFSRRQTLDPRSTDINALVSGMEPLLRRAISASIDIAVVPDDKLWPALVDPAQLEAAVLNLTLNARDAMPAGGRITIETANLVIDETSLPQWSDLNPGAYVTLAVSDTGTGMTAEVRRRAFEPFFTTKDVGKGSGLGLSMVYGFVSQTGGHVKIYSEWGEGTTVRLILPRAMTKALATTQAEVAQDACGDGELILVVEDDDLVREHVTAQLKTLGYRVVDASDAHEALDRLELLGDEIDLLFTDIVMPRGMNGRELADTARRRRPSLRILFTSGYAENAISHQGRLAPGVSLLSKPYRRQELAAKVRSVLDGPPPGKIRIGGGKP